LVKYNTYKKEFSHKMNAFAYYTVLKYDYSLSIDRPYFENNKWVVDWGVSEDKIIGFLDTDTDISDDMLELAKKEAEKDKTS
tara:strand:- start:74 stop:319 length:246 start_codon:yes stop_codon:yes gene_type:complete